MKNRLHNNHHRFVLCSFYLAVSAGFTNVTAQPAGSIAIEEIIVTAQRREQALEDVPMTVTVISSETMEAAGVDNLRDLQQVTTGLQIAQAGAFPQPAIRGITTLTNGTSFENNVAVYIDGIYQVASQTLRLDLPNVESIQVLKGPQGTLYGRNATGGAILINTIDPNETWQGSAKLTYGRFEDVRAGGYIAGPISDRVGISLAAYTRETDGYFKRMSRTEPGETDGRALPMEQDSVRTKLKFDVTENVVATLAYNYTLTSDGTANIFSTIENVVPLYNFLPGGSTRVMELGQVAFDIETKIETKQHDGFLKLDFDTGIGQLTSYTSYATMTPITSFDFDGSYIPAIWSTSEFEQNTFQQALDFNIDSFEGVDLIVGATYFDDDLETTGPQIPFFLGPAFIGTPFDPTTPDSLDNYVLLFERVFKQDKEAWAVYADATFNVTDRLSVTVGGRYNEETQDIFIEQSGSPVFPPTEDGEEYSEFTPRASIRYEIDPRTSVYASYSKGFRSGAFNASLPTDISLYQPADQETVDAYEIGYKTVRSALRFDVAAFYYDYEDLHVSVTQTGASGAPETIIDNAPSAEIYGVEGSFDFKILENLTLRGGVTWLQAEYGDGFLFNGSGVSNDPAEGGGVGINESSDPLKTFLNISVPNMDLSGLEMSRSPEWTANLGLNYLITSGIGDIRVATNLKYTDSYVVTNPSVWGAGSGVPVERQREQRFREGSYTLVNASATWTDSSEQYHVQLWGKNLTDEEYRIHYNGTPSFGTYSPIGYPISYGVTIGYNFQ